MAGRTKEEWLDYGCRFKENFSKNSHTYKELDELLNKLQQENEKSNSSNNTLDILNSYKQNARTKGKWKKWVKQINQSKADKNRKNFYVTNECYEYYRDLSLASDIKLTPGLIQLSVSLQDMGISKISDISNVVNIINDMASNSAENSSIPAENKIPALTNLRNIQKELSNLGIDNIPTVKIFKDKFHDLERNYEIAKTKIAEHAKTNTQLETLENKIAIAKDALTSSIHDYTTTKVNKGVKRIKKFADSENFIDTLEDIIKKLEGRM